MSAWLIGLPAITVGSAVTYAARRRGRRGFHLLFGFNALLAAGAVAALAIALTAEPARAAGAAAGVIAVKPRLERALTQAGLGLEEQEHADGVRLRQVLSHRTGPAKTRER